MVVTVNINYNIVGHSMHILIGHLETFWVPSFILFFELEVHKYKLCDLTAVSKNTFLVSN